MMAYRDFQDEVEVALGGYVGPSWLDFGSMSRERRDVAEAFAKRMPEPVDARTACEEAGRHHAYETGVLLALSTSCRSPGGASALGLPPVRDPVVRAILASRGREAILPEAFGPVAQWLAERAAGRPLPGLVLTAAADAVRAMPGVLPVPAVGREGRSPSWAR